MKPALRNLAPGLLAAALVFFAAVPAQASMLRLKLGASLSTQTTSNGAAYASYGTGYMGGLGVDLGMGPVGFMVDFMLAQRTIKLGAASAYPTYSLLSNNLYIPAQLRFRIVPMFGLTLGGYYSQVLGNGSLLTPGGGKLASVVFEDAQKSDYGVVGGLGLTIPMAATSLSLEARYNFGMKDVGTSGVGLKNRSIDFLIGVGF